jgi:hypothetical protein
MFKAFRLYLLLVLLTSLSAAQLAYSTYLGGSGSDGISASHIDPHGDVIVIGQTQSPDFPTTDGVLMPTSNAGQACGGPVGTSPCTVSFVSKLRADGSGLLASTFFPAYVSGFATDSSGNVYLSGVDCGKSLTVNGYTNGQGCLFVAKLAADFSHLIYVARFGSTSNDHPQAIAVDSSGAPYVAGFTYGSDFPFTAGAFHTLDSGPSAFALKLSSDFTKLNYSARLGGSLSFNSGRYGTEPKVIAVNAAGEAFVGGFTQSSTFPVTANAYRTKMVGGTDGFLTRISADGSRLIYSTYFGNSQMLSGYAFPYLGVGAIYVDSSGYVYIAGDVSQGIYGTPGAFQTNPGGSQNQAFVAKLDTNQVGSASLLRATLLGSIGSAYANSVLVDSTGQVYVSGFDSDPVFPTTVNGNEQCGERTGMFTAVLSADLSHLLFSNLFGPFDPAGNSASPAGGGFNSLGDFYSAGAVTISGLQTTAGAFRTSVPATEFPEGFVTEWTQAALTAPVASISICNPAYDGANSPFPVVVRSILHDTRLPSAWKITADGTTAYQTATPGELNTSLPLGFGTHTLRVTATRANGTTVSATRSVYVPSNPVPDFTNLADVTVPAGSAARTITFGVSGLVPTGYLTLNGSLRTTKLTTLTTANVMFPSTDFAQAGTYTLRLINPAPGGGTSPSSINLIVSGSATGTCSAPTTSGTIHICSPGTSAISPVHVLATAYASSGVKLAQVYVDGVKLYQASGARVDTSIAMTSGTRRLTLQAEDNTGAYFKSTVYVTVSQ